MMCDFFRIHIKAQFGIKLSLIKEMSVHLGHPSNYLPVKAIPCGPALGIITGVCSQWRKCISDQVVNLAL